MKICVISIQFVVYINKLIQLSTLNLVDDTGVSTGQKLMSEKAPITSQATYVFQLCLNDKY